jgi:hypothetical protein
VKEEHGKKLRRSSYGKTEIDGEAVLLDKRNRKKRILCFKLNTK